MKYKTEPKTTSDMVFVDEKTKNELMDMINQTSQFPIAGIHSLLLYGIYGTGKTTYANIFLNDFECHYGGCNPHIETIVCEKGEKISSIINHCNSIAYYESFNYSGYHYFIFDEVDNLTIPAQRALKSFLTKKNVVCVLTTNFIGAIDDGVIARCEVVNFNASNEVEYFARFKQILMDNKLPLISDEAMGEIVRMYNGNWRKMIKSLTRAARNYGEMTVAA